ncbi:hypothetical protein IMG5_143780 [Ichthyophthirius multifiliis]|uniref:DUS-like FMN-binding domain-containing protein n=1 Tax=Ichthyophthirius multifiliis TaxID=5932 RepID=G0QXL2_ICHMU|nr:hypothetical protein IMG5_143780 [Ichthyophthirius multifiliis]EGR30042.1 hypothetical protein IMG5_143780 [Ichthyophthirius multifiliis]|eukprot:XP_004031278.1 hypothetical protein IMG5_143780 [Ichthyophthirius multifiliis]
MSGNNPKSIADAAKLCEKVGYDEINLNVGCPSDRVQNGKFGACLMKEPTLIAEIMREIKKVCSIPCTVKCRLGVDEFDQYEFVHQFVKVVSEEGQVEHFIIHARKAFLKGLNPAQNRNIPPLKYDYVLRLKKDFPNLKFTINGGFKTYESIEDILRDENQLYGCMVGRLAYENPWKLSDVDRRFFGKKNPGLSRKQILEEWGKYGKYVQEEEENNLNYSTLNKPIINLFAGEKNNSIYRQFLSDRSFFKKFENYQIYIQNCIQEYEKINPEAMNQKPITDEAVENNLSCQLIKEDKFLNYNIKKNDNKKKIIQNV